MGPCLEGLNILFDLFIGFEFLISEVGFFLVLLFELSLDHGLSVDDLCVLVDVYGVEILN